MTFLHILKRSSSAWVAALLLMAAPSCLLAQNATLPDSTAAVKGSWPTFNGDYSGRRFSPLAQINQTNVGSLKLAWAFQTHAAALKSTPLEVGGILYFAVPNRVWAIDAKTGRASLAISSSGRRR